MLRSTLKLAKGAALGATTTYYFDPDLGRARRARLRDQLLAASKRAARSAGKRARYELGRVTGREAGVVRVEDLTHLPDEGAPNKAEGLDASRRASHGRRAG